MRAKIKAHQEDESCTDGWFKYELQQMINKQWRVSWGLLSNRSAP
jgi:hypothetical protein